MSERLEENETPVAQSWLSGLAPPLDEVPGLDRQMPPTVKQRVQQLAQLADWLADQLRYQARDYRARQIRSGVADFAGALLRTGGPQSPPRDRSPALCPLSYGPLGVSRLSENNSPLQVPLRIDLIGGPRTKAALLLQVFNPDRQWLKTQLKETPTPMPAVDGAARLDGSAAGGSAAGHGFPGPAAAARFTAPGKMGRTNLSRQNRHTADEPGRGGAAHPQCQLQKNRAGGRDHATAREKQASLFPVCGQQRSGATQDHPGGQGGRRTPQRRYNDIYSGSGQKEKVALGSGVLLPKDDIPEFQGPLEVSLFDADTRAMLARRVLAVDVALPRNYVRIADIQFRPATALKKKNRLQVGLRSLLSVEGPDIPVELVLPADRIPGLLAVKDGTLKGMLKTKSEPEDPPLELYAEELEFREVPDDNGVAYLNVDGYERAFIFHTTFSRRGPPTTPKGDIKPAVRFRASVFCRPATKRAC